MKGEIEVLSDLCAAQHRIQLCGNMIWGLLFLAVARCLLGASAQPATCESDQQCQSGYHCVSNVFQCRRCLDCEDLKRDLPRAPTACIKSVLECGSCIKGFVEDLGGDVTAECVAKAEDATLPAWAWVAVSLGFLLFVLVVVAVLYVLRNTNTFKILASTRTSVRSPGVVASAPDAPPPYRAHYHHHNDDHRNNHGGHDTYHYDTDTENYAAGDHSDLLPDVADPSAPSDAGSPPASPRAARKPRVPPPGPRESAARQATRFYNEPYYVRPPRYSDAGVSSPAAPLPEPPSLHDEDTMESTWTPTAHDDNGNVASGGELAKLLATARLNDQCRHHHHPPTQDSNNNRSSGAALSGSDPSGSAPAGSVPRALPQAPVSLIINMVQNMQNRT